MSDLCTACWMQPAATGDTECDDCRRWTAYYRSLTPAEQAEENRMMADYAEEARDA